VVKSCDNDNKEIVGFMQTTIEFVSKGCFPSLWDNLDFFKTIVV
jgi:hypothetical protein